MLHRMRSHSRTCRKRVCADSELLFLSESCAGLYPLGNLAAPKNPRPQIRIVRARNGQNTGTTSVKYGDDMKMSFPANMF